MDAIAAEARSFSSPAPIAPDLPPEIAAIRQDFDVALTGDAPPRTIARASPPPPGRATPRATARLRPPPPPSESPRATARLRPPPLGPRDSPSYGEASSASARTTDSAELRRDFARLRPEADRATARRRRRRAATADRRKDEARGCRPALRRGHQRRRRAARPLHRRTPGAPRRRSRSMTTCARDYVTWKNELPAGVEQVNGITRPPLPGRARARSRTSSDAARIQVFDKPHSLADELALARQRRAGEPGAGAARRSGGGGLRLRRPLQLSLLPRLASRAPHAGEGGHRPDRGARCGDRPLDLRPGVPRRARPRCTTRRKSAR